MGILVTFVGLAAHLGACVDPKYGSDYQEIHSTPGQNVSSPYNCSTITMKCTCTEFIAHKIRSIDANCKALKEKKKFLKDRNLTKITPGELLDTPPGECVYLPIIGLEECFLVIVIFSLFLSTVNLTIFIMLAAYSVIPVSLKIAVSFK
jgi:hypothetical protein